MDVLYITNSRLPTEKAHGFQIVKMCEALARAAAKVELIVPYRENNIKESSFGYWPIEKIFVIKTLGSLDFFNFKIIPSKLAFLLNSIYFSFLALKYVKSRSGADYIYTRNRGIIFISFFINAQIVYEMHTAPRFLSLYKFLFSHLRKIITITNGLKKVLVEHGINENKMLVLPDGVDILKFDLNTPKEILRKELGLPLDKKIILYAGQLYLWKGVDTLLLSSNHFSNDTLVVIVGGSLSSVKEAAKIPHSNVIFVGQKKSEEIPKWLKCADVLVLPNSAKYPISKYYTSPLKLFEYMASGVPIVSSDLPSLREILTEEDAIFFTPDDAHDLGRAVKTLLEDKVLAKTIASHAYNKVKNFTWDKRAGKIIYELSHDK